MDCIISLIYYTTLGKELTKNTVEIFARQMSVTRQEFYMSYQSGLKPTIMFKVRAEDFELSKTIDSATSKAKYASKILFDNAEYDIIRTYQKGGFVEIVCG